MDLFSGRGRVLMAIMVSPLAESEALVTEDADPLIAPFEHLDSSASRGAPFAPTYSPGLAPQGLNTLGCLALTALERGRLRAAQALSEEGLEVARCRGWSERPQAAVVNLVLALVHLERARYAEAEKLLHASGHVHRVDPDPTCAAVHIAHARLLVAVGRLARARSVLDGLQDSRQTFPDAISRWLTLVEAELCLAEGHPDAVSERARSMAHPTGAASDRVRVVTARVELAQGHLAEADLILAGVRETSTNPVVCAEAWLVTALSADRRRNDHQALSAMDQALAIAEPENIRRPFLAFGDRVEAMLRHRQRLTPDPGAFVTGLLAEFDTSEPAVTAHAVPSDPLTDREHMVLRHMATLQTNDDIAADLCISVNTVKAHAKSVYRKFAVANRREAVVRARELRLF
jgi:LuxR family transcriptional regulator, maltose regulon positive regulatory protein